MHWIASITFFVVRRVKAAYVTPSLGLVASAVILTQIAACGGGDSSGGTSGGGTAAGQSVSRADAQRFLEQSSFGSTDAETARVQSMGLQAYLADQFNTPSSGYPGFVYYPHSADVSCQYDSTQPNGGPGAICNRDNYTLFQVQRMFFQNALSGPDQLRQRVAFALSQIFVVSGTEIYEAYGMAGFQQMLADNAFGNFRDLLMNVTLSPVMGNYLDMVNNDKPNPTRGTEPNENYARELMQLFSIGLYALNPDGTQQTDAQGKPIPTYDQDVIEGYAHVFTGWTYAPRPGVASKWTNPINYEGPMVVVTAHHDTGTKELLGGRVLPANQTPEKDLSDAIDSIFNHTNVGPFIGKQLIQKLVTGNPSPAYVARVTAAFNNNGQGVRGDMKAVISAILLDPEARGDAKTAADYGHLREPALHIASLLRTLGGVSDGVYLRGQMSSQGQNLYTPASVFNYYPPDYLVPGTTTLGPEFGIQDTSTTLNRANLINQIVFGGGANPDTTVTGAVGTKLDVTPLAALTDPAQLVDRLNDQLLHNSLSGPARNAIIQAVTAVPASSKDTTLRAKTAVYLIATSPQYQVER